MNLTTFVIIKKTNMTRIKGNLFFIKLKLNLSWIGYAWINSCTAYLTTNKIKQNSIPFIIIYHLQWSYIIYHVSLFNSSLSFICLTKKYVPLSIWKYYYILFYLCNNLVYIHFYDGEIEIVKSFCK